jgi:hypothetical protein
LLSLIQDEAFTLLEDKQRSSPPLQS